MWRVKSRKQPISRSWISLDKAEKETGQMMSSVYGRPLPDLTWHRASSLAPEPRRACPCLGVNGASKLFLKNVRCMQRIKEDSACHLRWREYEDGTIGKDSPAEHHLHWQARTKESKLESAEVLSCLWLLCAATSGRPHALPGPQSLPSVQWER